MKKSLIQMLNAIDRLLARNLVRAGIEKNSMITLLFHGLVENEKTLNSGLIKPDYVVSTSFLNNTIEYFLSVNYQFVNPQDILNGLPESKKYVFLTFDDGYFNNSMALPILEKYEVPAAFFISSYYVKNNKSFWWDVVYREYAKRNGDTGALATIFASFERAKIHEIENNLIEQFGEDALKPVGDIDRPFTVSELKAFATHELVHLGNHTSKHAVLSILEKDEMLKEYTECQDFLKTVNNDLLPIVSYPMGYYNKEIATLSKEFGFKLGFTVNEQKNYFPIKTDTIDALLLNRFTPLHCKDWNRQLLNYRTDFSLKKSLKKLLVR